MIESSLVWGSPIDHLICCCTILRLEGKGWHLHPSTERREKKKHKFLPLVFVTTTTIGFQQWTVTQVIDNSINFDCLGLLSCWEHRQDRPLNKFYHSDRLHRLQLTDTLEESIFSLRWSSVRVMAFVDSGVGPVCRALWRLLLHS